MKKIGKRLLWIIIAVTMMVSCAEREQGKIERAVRAQLELYPEARLQDLYKAFFQAQFGAEHIVADTTSAGKYLDWELQTSDQSDVLFEPIGADSSFFRVHLCAVQKGYITRQELFDAFVGGVWTVEIPEIGLWASRWEEILKVIDSMPIELDGFEEDKALIDEVLASGHYAVHHSETFSEKYDPHYRIVRKDLFYSQLYQKLCKVN